MKSLFLCVGVLLSCVACNNANTQAAAPAPAPAPKVFSEADVTRLPEGFTQKYGKTSTVNLDFMELQQEIQVEPAAMSMLSVDDEIRRTGALQLVEMAGQMPSVVDPYYAAHNFASTIKGVDADKAVPPPKPPTPPPPKVSVTIAVKWPELPADMKMQILQAAGANPTPQTQQELEIDQTLQGIGKLSEAANHADNLMSDKSVDDEPETPFSKRVNNPPTSR